jgi:hypothetical protein
MDPAVRDFFLIVGAALAAYFGAYFKRRGEDKAVKDGFKDVLKQTRETTDATKRIEARIDDEVWDRQQRWQMKKDMFFEAVKKISAAKDKLTNLYSIYQTYRAGLSSETDERKEKRIKAYSDFNDAIEGVEEAAMLIDLVCEDELKRAVYELGTFMRRSAAKISDGQTQAFIASLQEFQKLINTMNEAMRKEINLKSQSNGSSTAAK